MANKEQTTVNLTDKAKQIRNRLAPAFGLKYILSLGLELLDELSDTEQKLRITKIVEEDQSPKWDATRQQVDQERANARKALEKAEVYKSLLTPEQVLEADKRLRFQQEVSQRIQSESKASRGGHKAKPSNAG